MTNHGNSGQHAPFIYNLAVGKIWAEADIQSSLINGKLNFLNVVNSVGVMRGSKRSQEEMVRKLSCKVDSTAATAIGVMVIIECRKAHVVVSE